MTWFRLEQFPRKLSHQNMLTVDLSRAALVGMIDLSLSPSPNANELISCRKFSLTKFPIEIYTFKSILHSSTSFHKPEFCIEPDILEHLHIGE